MLIDEKNDIDHVEKANAGSVNHEHDAPLMEDWTPEEERAIVKKADWRVFPMLCIVRRPPTAHLPPV